LTGLSVVCFVKSIEGMEELLLRSFLSGNELYVVYKQYVNISVFGSEFFISVVFNGIDKFVGNFSDETYKTFWEEFCSRM